MNPPSNSTMPADTPQQVTQQQHLSAVGIAMIGVVGATFALTAIRVIGTRVHAFISINYFSVWCSVVSLACLVIFPDVKFRLPGNVLEWGLLAVLGFCGFVMQFLLTEGLAYGGPSQDQNQNHNSNQREGQRIRDLESIGPAQMEHAVHARPKSKASGTRATAMCYTQMLFALAGDKLVFGVTPDTMSWVGSVLILAGAVWVAAARDTAAKDKKKKTDQRDAVGIHSAFGLLRRQATGKEAEASHEEAVGLMTGGDDGNEVYDSHDDHLADGARRNDHGNDNKMIESLEMRELRPSASGN
jgi:hypothetical protein